ncbi:MAG TPA: peptidoglycan recognition family protein [Planctomycetota bacterium]|nr:peptidoglycan recognition family protein [Planctomycetota bacterium]
MNSALTRFLVLAVPLLIVAQAALLRLPPDKETLEAPDRAPLVRPGDKLARSGDEIMVCGQLFHVGAPVVLWTDPGGYDAYRTECRFGPIEQSAWEVASLQNKELKTPARYNLRREGLTPEQIERVRGGGWDLELLQGVVDQFVLHYDQSGTSRRCFQTLHDRRCLSIHFMIDLDGTIYQTLDLKERAWHATTSNSRSVGIEIANIGAFTKEELGDRFNNWYTRDENGWRVKLPEGEVRTPGFVARPLTPDPVSGEIQGKTLMQYDFTPQQYESLVRLTAALCRIFPKLPCDYPRDDSGMLIPHKLPDDQLKSYRGLLGHYHIQTNKVDPGPALDWERIVNGARAMMRE